MEGGGGDVARDSLHPFYCARYARLPRSPHSALLLQVKNVSLFLNTECIFVYVFLIPKRNIAYEKKKWSLLLEKYAPFFIFYWELIPFILQIMLEKALCTYSYLCKNAFSLYLFGRKTFIVNVPNVTRRKNTIHRSTVSLINLRFEKKNRFFLTEKIKKIYLTFFLDKTKNELTRKTQGREGRYFLHCVTVDCL